MAAPQPSALPYAQVQGSSGDRPSSPLIYKHGVHLRTMPLQMLAVQSRADCANNVLGASTWCAQTIIMGGTSATEIPMTQRPATVIAAIALKYALHEAHPRERRAEDGRVGRKWD